jgi:hypothetical protein
MRFNSSATCLVTYELTGAVARGCIQAASYSIQRRFAAEKWVILDPALEGASLNERAYF